MPTNKWSSKDMPDMGGKVAIVTGANSGIGFETARALAQKNAAVILACRNQTKGQNALEQIQAELPTANVTLMELDLSSLASVGQFAQTFKDQRNQLDLLINNAGVMIPPYSKTADGFELQFGTNHLGHFALTGLLLPLILQTPQARVVTVSSMTHRMGKINFDDLQWEKGYNGWRAYGQSKLANLLFSYELQRKFETINASQIAVAAHPGYTRTNIQRHSLFVRMLDPLGHGPEQGAWPTLYAATEDVKGGSYFGPRGFMEIHGHPKQVSSSRRSHDKEVAAKLWHISEQLTGVKFEFEAVRDA